MTKDQAMLLKFTNCQKVQPYQGWDIKALNRLEHEVLSFLEKEVKDDKIKAILTNFSRCRTDLPYRAWSIRNLNFLADEARELLGLPSVLSLNPALAKMTAIAKDVTLADALKNPHLKDTEGRLRIREEMLINQFRGLTLESQLRLIKVFQDMILTADIVVDETN